MKSNLTLGGLIVAVFGAAAAFAFSGGLFAVILLAAGLVVAAAGAYQEAQAKDAVREAALQYVQDAAGGGDSALQDLRRTLSKLRFESGFEKDAARALAQLDLAEKRFRTFEAALRARLNPGEMTYDRYLGAGRQVLDAVVSGLSEVAGLMPGETLPDGTSGSAGDSRVKALPRSGERRLDVIFNGNDRALRELQAAHAAVTQWQGGAEMSRDLGKRLEDSVAELRDLARQAGKYR